MLHEYHVIYSVRYYPWFHVTAVGLGTYYQWIRGTPVYANLYVSYMCLFDIRIKHPVDDLKRIEACDSISGFVGRCICVCFNTCAFVIMRKMVRYYA
jgi:hypothetical protein